jgi:hypothetical protein
MLVLLAAGCAGGKPDVPFGMVHGKVTWQGAPLADASVAFEPDRGRTSYGRTNAAGDYELRYKGKPWGAIAGRHRVRITTETASDDETGRTQLRPEILPPKYHSASTLVAEVHPGDNVIDFDLAADR